MWDRPNARQADGPRDLWYVFRPEQPSAELYGIVWVWSTLLTLHQTYRRQKRLAAATEQLTELKRRLGAARARLRGAAQIDLQVAQILERYSVGRYLKVWRVVREVHSFMQARRSALISAAVTGKIDMRALGHRPHGEGLPLAHDESHDLQYDGSYAGARHVAHHRQ